MIIAFQLLQVFIHPAPDRFFQQVEILQTRFCIFFQEVFLSDQPGRKFQNIQFIDLLLICLPGRNGFLYQGPFQDRITHVSFHFIKNLYPFFLISGSFLNNAFEFHLYILQAGESAGSRVGSDPVISAKEDPAYNQPHCTYFRLPIVFVLL